jgi:hypothetical protein
MKHDALTTEKIRKKFKNNFDLCNFAINIARNTIHGGTYAPLLNMLKIIDERAEALKNQSNG